MSEPISVGDLVMVVRWPHKCLPRPEKAVAVFVVQYITPMHPICPRCDEQIEPGQPSAWYDLRNAIPIPWLKRIPPLSELEGQRTEESLREPKVKA